MLCPLLIGMKSGNTYKQRAIEDAADAVLAARALYHDATLADLYDPYTMPLELVTAHARLDRVVEIVVTVRKHLRASVSGWNFSSSVTVKLPNRCWCEWSLYGESEGGKQNHDDWCVLHCQAGQPEPGRAAVLRRRDGIRQKHCIPARRQISIGEPTWFGSRRQSRAGGKNSAVADTVVGR
jgi:hypothetical protein